MSTSIAIQPTNCQSLLDLAAWIIRKATHGRSMLWVEMETERLMRLYPDCHMSRDEVRNVLSRKAVDRRIAIAFG